MAASQSDVQKLIQGLVPGSVNNGNPNTAYNVAPPSMDANGNWFAANLPTAASIDALQLPSYQGWQPPAGTGGGTLGPILTNPGWDGNDGWSPSVPTTPNPTTPPISDPGVQGPTPVTPGTAVGPGMPDPVGTFKPGQGSYVPPGFGGIGGRGDYTNAPTTGVTPSGYVGEYGLYSPNVYNDLVSDLAGRDTSIYSLLQGAEPGSWGSIMEAIDKISEPWFQGDFVQGGNFNWRQLLDSVGDQILPGTVEGIANLLGKGDQYRAWISEGYGDLGGTGLFGSEAMGNTQGYEVGQINPITGQVNWGLGMQGNNLFQSGTTPVMDLINSSLGTNINNPGVQQALLEMTFGAGSTAPARTAPTKGQIAGASVIEGQAARDFVDAMKNADIGKNFQSNAGVSIFGGNGVYKS